MDGCVETDTLGASTVVLALGAVLRLGVAERDTVGVEAEVEAAALGVGTVDL